MRICDLCEPHVAARPSEAPTASPMGPRPPGPQPTGALAPSLLPGSLVHSSSPSRDSTLLIAQGVVPQCGRLMSFRRASYFSRCVHGDGFLRPLRFGFRPWARISGPVIGQAGATRGVSLRESSRGPPGAGLASRGTAKLPFGPPATTAAPHAQPLKRRLGAAALADLQACETRRSGADGLASRGLRPQRGRPSLASRRPSGHAPTIAGHPASRKGGPTPHAASLPFPPRLGRPRPAPGLEARKPPRSST